MCFDFPQLDSPQCLKLNLIVLFALEAKNLELRKNKRLETEKTQCVRHVPS
jgi:hypothetical protein